MLNSFWAKSNFILQKSIFFKFHFVFWVAYYWTRVGDDLQRSIRRCTWGSGIMSARCPQHCRPTLAGRSRQLLHCLPHCHSTRLPHLTDLWDLPFYCMSTNCIRLTAPCYSSIDMTMYLYAVALLGSPAKLVVQTTE